MMGSMIFINPSKQNVKLDVKSKLYLLSNYITFINIFRADFGMGPPPHHVPGQFPELKQIRDLLVLKDPCHNLNFYI
jgi:hypothetical protein